MATFVGLIRGINVGKAKRVAMGELRAGLEALGYERVRTLLNSGNVVFDAPARTKPAAAAARIEAVLADGLGVPAKVTVLTAAELAEIVAANPLAAGCAEPARLLVAVLATPAHARKLEPLAAKVWAPDALAVSGRAAYYWCAAGSLESPVAIALTKALGDGQTSRNHATMTKLVALANG